MSDSFICNICKQEIPILNKVNKFKRCNECHKKERKEYREKHKELINLRKKVDRIINIEKYKEHKTEYNIKRRNAKYGYTEDKIKEINERWENMQKLINANHEKNNYPPKIYTKALTPKLKETYMKPYLFLVEQNCIANHNSHNKNV